MPAIYFRMDTAKKLDILAQSSRFDLACACKRRDEPGRLRGPQGRWIYPAALPSGRKVFLLKTLQSNHCVNDCTYCPFNASRDLRRCTLEPEALAKVFVDLKDAGRVSGLFLSSGVVKDADATMTRMLSTVELLRKRYKFRGFIHLKVIPGASQAAIEQAVRLATRVSVNIETPNAQRLSKVSAKKRFHEDIIAAMNTINQIRQDLGRPCDQTTQFVVGAAGETDREIVLATDRLYQKFDIGRVYFSAYQDLTAIKQSQKTLFENMPAPREKTTSDIFIREHRLYQVDFLLRKYGFSRDDFYFEPNGNLAIQQDPKSIWAARHPGFFPVNVNQATRWQLLRVPGIGPLSAKRILSARRQRHITDIEDLPRLNVRSRRARSFLTC